MISFINDYCQCAHKVILDKIIGMGLEKNVGYGKDKYCDLAKEKIKKACGLEDGEVWFLVGGTQTNQVIIDSMLKPYEGVIATEPGHISCHEAGAIEYTGHKVLNVPSIDGKIDPVKLREYLNTFYNDDFHEHMVFPGMVYITYPTEFGTLYSKSELVELRTICDEYNLKLFLDGARLGYGLASSDDVTLEDIAKLTDVFYNGDKKVGALFGEA
ncbi:MAG: aminotransferase class I/II-fold pyridoxal phosphate-dependent enzyme, partial [Clostridia bacterium]|nr:aminotransferase class I/II-fold pyridoxal phosphate-dependent enzyme [Clostridia bacterium]